MKDIRTIISKSAGFLKGDVWRVRLADLSPARSFFIKQLRTVLLTLRGFDQDKCQLRASALTYYTMLSIVPVVAMAFGVAKGFGFEKRLEGQLLAKFAGQQQVITRVIAFAESLLDNTKGGLIAGIGVLVLFWSVVQMLTHIEVSFNEIWEIKKHRSLGRKLSDYLSIMLVSPVLLIVSGSATVILTTQTRRILEKIAVLGPLKSVILFAMNLLPYCLIWVLFTFIYLSVPNTSVKLKSAFYAGVVAGSMYQVVQWAYINFQVGIARYNAIYGSFAALPLFLVWLQLSWLIVLFGAEFSFASQNVESYEFEQDSRKVSLSFKKLLSLQITTLLVKSFSSGGPPLTEAQVSEALKAPIRLVRTLLHELTESNVIVDVHPEEGAVSAYLPACDTGMLSVMYVIEALEARGTDSVPIAETMESERLATALQSLRETVEKSPENLLLKDI